MDHENAVGRAEDPNPSANAVYESALIVDLELGATTSGEFRLAVTEPGAYLLRVESLRTQREHGHFAAIDLDIR